MKNKITKSIAIGLMLLALVSGVGTAFAENSVSVEASSKLSVPAGYTVIPPKDKDRSNDQIVQLENLVIQNISGSVPGTVYASREATGPCREYLDLDGKSGSRVYPCPLAPTVLYQISVESDTILLLRNRTRATIKDFAVGDHINVFGFLDRGTSGVEALIMRDLDKPTDNTGRYVQLNNLTVVSEPDAKTPPATFRAARKGVEPCFLFVSAVSSRADSSQCPIGVDIQSDTMLRANSEIYRPFLQYYSIQVSSSTKLLGLSRQAISLSDIQLEDHINVYGRYIPGTRMIEALIVRDLSVPRADNGTAGLNVILTNRDIVCITTPCGQVNDAKVELYRTDSDSRTLVASQVTVDGQASFRGLKPGNYLVTASGSGFSSVSQKVTLKPGETGKVMLWVSSSSDSDSDVSISSVSPKSAEPGQTIKVKGKGFDSSENAIYIGDQYVALVGSKDGSTLSFTLPEYVGVCPYDPADQNMEKKRVCIALAVQLKPGKSSLYIKTRNGTSNSVSFEVLSSGLKY